MPHLSTLGRKLLMALTGLFLCVFLVVHLAGNLQLLLPAAQAQVQYNYYSELLSHNILIKLISYVLYASIIAHSVDAAWIVFRNREAAGERYAHDRRQAASPWHARNMGLLGSVILVFLIAHMKDFWFVYKFGAVPLDAEGQKDLYTVVVTAFGVWWYVLLNVIAFVALGYHLIHGVFSALRTLGLHSHRYARLAHVFGVLYSAAITLGFSGIAVYIHLTR